MNRICLAVSVVGLLVGCGGATSSNDAGGGSDAGADAGSPTCASYCTTLMANCTAAHQQFTGSDQCLASCKAMPVGTTADLSGNTLGCRTYHANAAKNDPATHCVHAGPGGAGVCGNNCDGYCQIAMMYCVADAGIYSSLSVCQSTCAKFATDVSFNVTTTSLQETGEVACLLYHAQEASVVPMDHCLGDLAPDPANHNSSVTCNNGPDAGP